MRKAHLFNQENKMKLINQQLYKRRKIAFKKLRIQQQQQQPPITINVNTGFETNRRIKEIYKKLELLTPQEVSPSREDMERALRMRDNELERKKQMEERNEQMREQIRYNKEQLENDKAVAEEELEISKERQMELKQQALMGREDMISTAKEEELYDEDFEREMMGKEDVKRIKKTKTLTPRELRLQSALKREKLLNQAKEKDKRNNLKELVLMNLNDKRINSLFG